MITMDKLINYILDKNKNIDYRIYCLIQKSSVSSFKHTYPYMDFIEKEDGFFNYKDFKNNSQLIRKFNSIYFDEIYIPSSTVEFNNFEETFMIVSKIKTNKNILFNCDGDIYVKRINFYLICLDKYFGNIVYCIKVLFALLGIAVIYSVVCPYYFIKNKFTLNKNN